MNEKYFVVTVEEIIRRRVIIKCESDADELDAEIAANDMCYDGTICLDAEDLQERNTTVLHEASSEELARLDIYEA